MERRFALELLSLIGEATEYDKKQMLEEKKPKSWCKSISAFANGIGGVLIFGIANDDTVVGLENAEHDQRRCQKACNKQSPLPFHTTLTQQGRFGFHGSASLKKGEETRLLSLYSCLFAKSAEIKRSERSVPSAAVRSERRCQRQR